MGEAARDIRHEQFHPKPDLRVIQGGLDEEDEWKKRTREAHERATAQQIAEQKEFDRLYAEAKAREDVAKLREKIQTSQENRDWDQKIATAHSVADAKEWTRAQQDQAKAEDSMLQRNIEIPQDIQNLSQRVDTVLARLPKDQQDEFRYQLEEATRSVTAEEPNSDDMDFSLGEDDVAPEAKAFEPSKTPEYRDFYKKSDQL